MNFMSHPIGAKTSRPTSRRFNLINFRKLDPGEPNTELIVPPESLARRQRTKTRTMIGTATRQAPVRPWQASIIDGFGRWRIASD